MSSVFVSQFEGKSHGHELGIAVPLELCAGACDLDIRTGHLMVLTTSEYGETTEPVTIRTPASTSSGVGMRAWLGETRFELLSKVRIHVEGRSPQP